MSTRNIIKTEQTRKNPAETRLLTAALWLIIPALLCGIFYVLGLMIYMGYTGNAPDGTANAYILALAAALAGCLVAKFGVMPEPKRKRQDD